MSEVAELGLARRPRRRGFTVVELLVVIAIIGILMSLITVAAYSALWTARQTRIKVEIDNLSLALKAFKEKYGSYPPISFYDPLNNPDLKSFVARAFPRYKQNEQKIGIDGNKKAALVADLEALGVDLVFNKAADDPPSGNPATALVFWLSGFRADVQNPFCAPGDVRVDGGPRAKLFDFEPTRVVVAETDQVVSLTDTDPSKYKPGRWAYLAPYGKAPYLYFDSRNYWDRTIGSNPPPAWFKHGVNDIAYPYWNNSTNPKDAVIDAGESFVNPDSFQLISAGQDGTFGGQGSTPWHLYPTGINLDTSNPPTKYPYAPEEKDNVTNFCEKNNLEDAKP